MNTEQKARFEAWELTAGNPASFAWRVNEIGVIT